VIEARTVATTVLVTVGLYLIAALEAGGRRRTAAVSTLAVAIAGLFTLVLATPFARDSFALAPPSAAMLATALVGAGVAVGGLCATDDRFLPRGTGEAR
jgi:cation-transporting P-type ATPase E